MINNCLLLYSGRPRDLMVSAPNRVRIEWSGFEPSPGTFGCVFNLIKTLFSHNASLRPS